MSALADRMPAERISPLLKEPREVTALDRLELLCDPGSLHVIRSTVLPRRESKRMREGDGVVGGGRHDLGAPGLLLRAGPVVRRRLAGRGARRDDRASDAARRPRQGARDRLRRVRRCPHGRRHRRSRRIRPDLPREREALRSRPADLRDHGRVRRRRRVLAGAHRLRRDDGGLRDVPHRPRRRARGHGRGRGCAGARRAEGAREERRLPVRRGQRSRGCWRGAGTARPPAAARRRAAAARPARTGAVDGPLGARAGCGTPGLRRAPRDPRDRGQRGAARGLAALGAQHGHGVLPDRWPRRSA